MSSRPGPWHRVVYLSEHNSGSLFSNLNKNLSLFSIDNKSQKVCDAEEEEEEADNDEAAEQLMPHR